MGFLSFLFKKKRRILIFHNVSLCAYLKKVCGDARIILRDRRYVALTLSDFMYFQRLARTTKKPKYEKEKFDCDDFAITYWADIKRMWAKRHKGNEALACGIVDGEFIAKTDEKPFSHTMIWVLTKDNGLTFIEPQIDAIPLYSVDRIKRLEG